MERGDVCIIQVDRELDLLSSRALASAFALAERTPLRIIANLEKCPYCDSAGINVLLTAKRRLGARCSIVVPPHSSVRRIFEITDLSTQLAVCASLREAMELPP